jgi:hypothetical protein
MSTVPNLSFATGNVVGTGAALNVSIGFVPRRVEVYNATDGDIITTAFLDYRIPFNTGVTTIAPNDLIKGATSGATARVSEVVLISGTFAAGNAAGVLIVRPEDITGTFQTENVYVPLSSTTTVAAVTVQVNRGNAVTTAAAAVVTTNSISPSLGSTTAAEGFTIGATVSESAKELIWSAWR